MTFSGLGKSAKNEVIPMRKTIFLSCIFLLALTGCSGGVQTPTVTPDRESFIPLEHEKITPENDLYPPQSFSNEFSDPVPLPYPVNTRGAEDSAFVMPDGNTLYVWFTPDCLKPVEEQAFDGVTGIYAFHKMDDTWGPAERVVLQDPGKAVLDGCEFVLENRIWFCSAREGFTGMQWFIADFIDGKWQNWKQANFNPDYEIGELHITADGKEMYFHSARQGGLGGYDIWLSRNVDGEWQEPENISVVNSPDMDGWPFISPDGDELWFTRIIGAPELWRSIKINGKWTSPKKMFANFAGEASMDIEGNLYFTHHFYKDSVMLEADIYTAHRINQQNEDG